MTLDLLLLGFGNVGRRFVRMLDGRREVLARDYGLEARIVGIATRRHGAAFSAAGLDALRAASLVERGEPIAAPGADEAPADAAALLRRAAARPTDTPAVVVETTPLRVEDGQPAIDYIRAALTAGLHVVSANKGPVAHAYRELADLARRAGVRYCYEGAVMDGIPVFSLVREAMPAVTVTGFRGVVNSTTNYIITRLEDGGEFPEALAEMQRQGIAEADPSLDVDGWDAAAKAAALANVLMDARMTPQEVEVTGVRGVTGASARDAVARGRRVRLVASARREGDRLRARVAPEELAADDPLALLRGMANALFLETDLLGRVGITQLDGGLTQTAYALLADLVAVRRGL